MTSENDMKRADWMSDEGYEGAVRAKRSQSWRSNWFGTVLAAASFIPLPLVGAVVLWHLYSNYVPLVQNAYLGVGMTVLFAVLALYGLAVCSLIYQLLSVVGIAVSAAIGGSPMLAAVLGESLLVMVSLFVANLVFDKLKKASVVPCESPASLLARNPRCATCHVKSLCPHKPGGIADRYRRVDLHPTVVIEE